jgi:hypothetical protein
MNERQIDALKQIVSYMLESEKTSFEEWENSGGDPSYHIYNDVCVLHNYLLENQNER